MIIIISVLITNHIIIVILKKNKSIKASGLLQNGLDIGVISVSCPRIWICIASLIHPNQENTREIVQTSQSNASFPLHWTNSARL